MKLEKYAHGHLGQGPTGLVLLGARYRASDEVRFPPPEFLHGEEAAEPVSMGSEGRLYTFTTVHPGKAPAYSLAMVDFPNGLRVFGRLLAPEGVPLALGGHMRVVAFTLPDGTADYAFEPQEGASA
ncbi:MAG: Zn-ribbon domain-containing OB-fold protein [Hydrogenophaga sp.]|uniref:Zn-ribbon domain-containing OB-fold protein n=1 Tax=Hydrogenophaga sp. TaxID=1904254 RepID=UPI004037437B